MREELVLHGWDITGDTEQARSRLARTWMTTHSVMVVGAPLLQRGLAALGSATEQFTGRLRVQNEPDIAVTANHDRTSSELVQPQDDATLETDSATRVLLLWGRRPADPQRIRSQAGPRTLQRLRTLLSGY